MKAHPLSDKTVVITGFYSGIGWQTTFELARAGMQIIGIGRSETKGEEAISQIKKKTGNNSIDFIQCDLAEKDQVKRTAEKINDYYNRVDVLINNAGTINLKRQMSTDGLENTFAVSAMASYLLTRLLLNKLLESSAPRVINLTSEGYKQGKVDFESFQGKGKYKTMSSYSSAKLAMMMWTYEMADRLADKHIVFRLVHPGLVPYSGGLKRMPWWIRSLAWMVRGLPVSKSPEEGAKPVIESVKGENDKDANILYLKEGKPEEPLDTIKDKQKKRAVWQFLSEITGVPEKIE